MKTKLFGLLAGVSIYAFAAQPAAAVSITFNASGTGGMEHLPQALLSPPVRSSVTLTNDLSAGVKGIRSAGQALSDLSFILSNNPGTLGNTNATGQLANLSCSPTRRMLRSEHHGEPNPVAEHFGGLRHYR